MASTLDTNKYRLLTKISIEDLEIAKGKHIYDCFNGKPKIDSTNGMNASTFFPVLRRFMPSDVALVYAVRTHVAWEYIIVHMK